MFPVFDYDLRNFLSTQKGPGVFPVLTRGDVNDKHKFGSNLYEVSLHAMIEWSLLHLLTKSIQQDPIQFVKLDSYPLRRLLAAVRSYIGIVLYSHHYTIYYHFTPR